MCNVGLVHSNQNIAINCTISIKFVPTILMLSFLSQHWQWSVKIRHLFLMATRWENSCSCQVSMQMPDGMSGGKKILSFYQLSFYFLYSLVRSPLADEVKGGRNCAVLFCLFGGLSELGLFQLERQIGLCTHGPITFTWLAACEVYVCLKSSCCLIMRYWGRVLVTKHLLLNLYLHCSGRKCVWYKRWSFYPFP